MALMALGDRDVGDGGYSVVEVLATGAAVDGSVGDRCGCGHDGKDGGYADGSGDHGGVGDGGSGGDGDDAGDSDGGGDDDAGRGEDDGGRGGGDAGDRYGARDGDGGGGGVFGLSQQSAWARCTGFAPGHGRPRSESALRVSPEAGAFLSLLPRLVSSGESPHRGRPARCRQMRARRSLSAGVFTFSRANASARVRPAHGFAAL